MANNSLFEEYLLEVKAKLEELSRAEASGATPEETHSLRFELQRLQSYALFFANEVYLTGVSAEQVLLVQQIGLPLELPTEHYLISINEQTAFIGEQIAKSEGNFGYALWKTAKYADRILFAIKKIREQEGELVFGKKTQDKVNDLRPLVGKLLRIKKGFSLASKEEKDLKSEEARNLEAEKLARENASKLGSSPPEWGRIILDLQIDVNLEIEEYLRTHPGSMNTGSSSKSWDKLGKEKNAISKIPKPQNSQGSSRSNSGFGSSETWTIAD